MALGSPWTLSKIITLVLKAAHMSHAPVGLTTNLALTLPVQVNFCLEWIIGGPSSQWGQIG